ncbi:MAG TPA: GspH/FimT family pseudopilin [Noviherbaspirillum sp.]
MCRLAPGFTLTELMAVVAIAAILLGLAVPGMRSLVQSQQITTAANDLLTAINLTRSEAIQRGRRVDLVPADGSHWNSGWLIFVDDNNNQVADKGERIIHTRDALPADLTIKAKLTGTDDYIAYQGSGRTRTNASSQTPMAGTLSLAIGNHERRIIINMMGRARVCNPQAKSNTC